MITADVDIRGFSRLVEGLQNALIGTGQDGDLFQVVKSEARQLAWEMSRQMGPTSRATGERKIGRDVGRVFAPGPDPAFEVSKRGGEQGITWLIASKKNAVLVGVKNEDAARPDMGLEFMERILRASQSAGNPRGDRRTTLGSRGRQKVVLINRVIVTRDRYSTLKLRLMERVGRLRASFASTAEHLGLATVPSWISRHFSAVRSEGVAIFRYRMEESAATAIEFGSRSPGVVSNPNLAERLRGAVERRKPMMLNKIQKILAGYRYDWNTGGVFKSNRGKEMIRQLEANEAAFNAL